VTQRNASAAEELSSTAEEMSSQAESLQQLMAFFVLAEQASFAHTFHAGQVRKPATPRAGAPAQPYLPPTRPANGSVESGFRKF
jgi:methyl-accepting chemotaxis protein